MPLSQTSIAFGSIATYNHANLIAEINKYEREIDKLWQGASPFFQKLMEYPRKKQFIKELRDIVSSENPMMNDVESKIVEGMGFDSMACHELRNIMISQHNKMFYSGFTQKDNELKPYIPKPENP